MPTTSILTGLIVPLNLCLTLLGVGLILGLTVASILMGLRFRQTSRRLTAAVTP